MGLGIWSRSTPLLPVQVVQRLRGWWRWKVHYARAWYSVMDGTDLLTTTKTRQVYVPRVVRVRSTKVVDRVELRLLHGQTPAQFAEAADGLPMCSPRTGARSTSWPPDTSASRSTDPTRCISCPCSSPVPGLDLDLTAVHVGLAEDGEYYLLRLMGTHVLGSRGYGCGEGLDPVVDHLGAGTRDPHRHRGGDGDRSQGRHGAVPRTGAVHALRR